MVTKFIKFLIKFIFPSECYVCKKCIDTDGLCEDCISKLEFITKPYCPTCGYPFEFYMYDNDSNLCPSCIKKSFNFDMARSVAIYNEMAKNIILPFKHADRTEFANLIAKLMINNYDSFIKSVDIILPIPIHLFRMIKRKYNQSSLIGNIIAKHYSKPIYYNVLNRIKNTASQGHLGIKERKQNLKNAFSIKHSDKIKDKIILLVDDVFTTGTTINECSKILKKYGAKKIFVITFARVIGKHS